MSDVLNQIIWGNSVKDYLISVVLFFCGLFLILIFERRLTRRIKKIVLKSNTEIDDLIMDALERFGIPVLRFLLFFWCSSLLNFPKSIEKGINIAYGIVLIYFSVRFLLTLIRKILEVQVRKQEHGEAKLRQIGGVMAVINIAVWTIALLLFFNNLGYNVSAILTGLGIGGIAIALAAQNILGDLFNYFVIFFDQPFEVGDFIVVDDKKGTVENIGVKTTRIKSISGEQLVISNSNLTGSRIHNFKRLESRRVFFTLGVTYDTPLEKLEAIPGLLRLIIENEKIARFDRAHFASYGDFSLNIEVVFFVETSDYNIYMDILHKINLRIYEVFKNEKINFAFPTQTVWINK